ncbi:MAG: hypothetical protein Unbinned4162contig1001_31 [Prokaryotic dsDNA virus sp.]|nr:MAG: hypothetical protein Unbinned4162contig1001_31 [Prokaryotic dsDNA virus sp.]|tara:strand:- start:7955 stop:8152 length:198 start_codon:yes stop_codon:yes gene_type:complete
MNFAQLHDWVKYCNKHNQRCAIINKHTAQALRITEYGREQVLGEDLATGSEVVVKTKELEHYAEF